MLIKRPQNFYLRIEAATSAPHPRRALLMSHIYWRYACPVVHIQCLLAFAQSHVSHAHQNLRLPPRPLQLRQVSSGLPLYSADADAPCLELLAALILRAFGSGLVSHLSLLLAWDTHASAQASLKISRHILSRVFGQHLLATVLEADLGFEHLESHRLLSTPPIALQLQPCAAYAYTRARGNMRWWDAARPCDLYGIAAHIDLGADLNAAESGSEWGLLHWAAVRGNAPVLELSISCGARVDARDRGGCTPLHLAARNDHVEVASLLIACGAAVDARGDGLCTPLHMAAFRGHCSISRLLISCGADLAARCNEQRTPLHWAAHEGHCDAIRLLISCGADVNASADEGCTPLHIATFKGQCPAILLLLEAGADVNARQMATTHSRDR